MEWNLRMENLKNAHMASYRLMGTFNSSGDPLFGPSIKGPLNCCSTS